MQITTSGVRTNTFYDGRPYGEFRDITTGPDGALWIATENEYILRMTVEGRFKAFKLRNEGTPLTIVTGPDLALWFTESVPARLDASLRREK
jgi:streptogramin lyase